MNPVRLIAAVLACAAALACGTANAQPASITGNRAKFETPCVNAPSLFLAMYPNHFLKCKRAIYIDAKPAAGVVHMSMDIELLNPDLGVYDVFTRFQMTLRRVAPEEEQGAATLKPVSQRRK